MAAKRRASTNVRFRQAVAGDIETIVAVVNAAYAVERTFVRTDRTHAADVAQHMEGGWFTIAEDAAGAVQGVIYLRDEGTEGYFGMLAVAPGRQGGGVGQALVRQAEETFGAMGIRRVRMVVPHVRDELFPWYAGQGYRERATLPFPEPEKLTRPVHVVELVKDIGAEEG